MERSWRDRDWRRDLIGDLTGRTGEKVPPRRSATKGYVDMLRKHGERLLMGAAMMGGVCMAGWSANVPRTGNEDEEPDQQQQRQRRPHLSRRPEPAASGGPGTSAGARRPEAVRRAQRTQEFEAASRSCWRLGEVRHGIGL